MNSYDVGDKVRLTANFKALGVEADPGAVACKYKKPDGTVTTEAYPGNVQKDSVGNYHLDIILDTAGSWAYRFSGTEPAQGAGESEVFVKQSAFP